MADRSFISRQKSLADDLDFDALREAGIDLVQRLSGDHWTDFNIHDPGVTILEALCYALSDLAYRSEFDVADYLADTGSQIDFEGLALFRPDKVLSCDPVTIEDLRKVVLSEIPEIRNIWIEPCTAGALAPALLSAFVQVQSDEPDTNDGQRRHGVERQLRKVLGRYRALGEDVDAVEFVEMEGFGLSGEIEIADGGDALAIAAEIHWRAQEYLNPRPGWRSHPDAFAREKDLERLLRGPLTKTGVLSGPALAPWRDQFSISELIGIVAGLPGVERINRLAFVGRSGEEVQTIDLRSPGAGRQVGMIELQADGDSAGVMILRAGRREQFAAAEIEREIARLTIQRSDFRSRPAQFDWIRTLLPQGKSREFATYHSIQHHFPDIYGLNAFGVPSSASASRHAQALQLKGYLLLHEQFMANFLAQLQKIPDLFSVFPESRESYSTLALGNDIVPRAEELYPQGLDGQSRVLRGMLDEFDDWVERRHRLLNRLLAMHGHDETRQLVDAIALARGNNSREALSAKQGLLSNIWEFGKCRMCGGGLADDDADGHGRAGLERNLAILFGGGRAAPGDDEGSPAGEAHSTPIRVVDHILLRAAFASKAAESIGADFFLFRVSVVISEALQDALSGEARTLIDRAIAICCPAHIAAKTVVLRESRFASFLDAGRRWRLARQRGDDTDPVSESAALLAYLAD